MLPVASRIGFGGEVLAGDQFQARILALGFMPDCLGNFRIHLRERPGHAFLFGHDSLFNLGDFSYAAFVAATFKRCFEEVADKFVALRDR